MFYVLLGKRRWQFQLCHEHQRFLDRQVRKQTIVLSDVSGTGAHHLARPRYAIQKHLALHTPTVIPSRQNVQQTRLPASWKT